MSMEIGPSMQAISALDISALAASENISNVNTDDYRPVRADLEDGLGGKGVRVADFVELSTSVPDLDGPAFPLVPSSQPTENETGLIRTTSCTGEGNSVDIAREMADLMQVERSYSANMATMGTIDNMTGNILDMMA